MWDDLQGGKIMRRQVRDEQGRLVGKIFRVEEIVDESDFWKVATVIDQDTMKRCTLKILTKSENLCKSQIVCQIKNQKKMSGRPNFIDLLQVYEDSNIIYLLMQHWGTPLERILAKKHTFMQRQAQLIFCQLVDILQNLRASNISHGNISLSSVLLTTNGDNRIQLTDFTNSFDISNCEPIDRGIFKITGSEYPSRAKWPMQNTFSNIDEVEGDGREVKSSSREINEYTSPQEYHQDKNNIKSIFERDIWACGVLLYKLLTGMFPFSDQNGKLILNKIKNATFSFPTLDMAKMAIEGSNFEPRKKDQLQFLSTQWKQLLKRMLSVRNQRISLRQLINHPFKSNYFELKSIPYLNTSEHYIQCMFSKTPEINSKHLFQKSWKINYDHDNSSQEQQSISALQIQSNNYLMKIKKNQSSENRIEGRDSAKGYFLLEKIKEEPENSITNRKHARHHRTQFGANDSMKSIQNHRHQTVDVLKQKIKFDKESSLITPEMTQKQSNNIKRMPQLVTQPPFIIKFKYFKKSGYLGYILNNSVGILYNDGQHVIGHTRDEYKYIEDTHCNSQILIDNSYSTNSQFNKSMKQTFCKSKLRNTSNGKMSNEENRSHKNKTNFRSEQVSSKDIQANQKYQNYSNINLFKYTTSNVINGGQNSTLSVQKFNIYLKALDYFGERVVKGDLEIWVDRYWRDGNIFIFLLNTGCWQVAFCEMKGFKIYAIDQYELSWVKIETSSDIIQRVRQLIRKYQLECKAPKFQ